MRVLHGSRLMCALHGSHQMLQLDCLTALHQGGTAPTSERRASCRMLTCSSR